MAKAVAANVVNIPTIVRPDDKVRPVTPSVEAKPTFCPSTGFAGNVMVSVTAKEMASCNNCTSCFVFGRATVPLVAVLTCFSELVID